MLTVLGFDFVWFSSLSSESFCIFGFYDAIYIYIYIYSTIYFANVFYFFYGRLILRPWLTEVHESFTRGGS